MSFTVKKAGSDPELNIVSFDVPYPPDYGGVIDVFYKIKELIFFSFHQTFNHTP